MPQLKITDYFTSKKNLPDEQFKRVLEQLNDGSYKETSIKIEADETDDEILINIMNDEQVILFCEALKRNPHVKEITFFLQDIGDKGAEALSKIDTLEKVDIYGGKIGISGACALAKTKLKMLSLAGNHIPYDKNDKRINKEKELSFIASLIDNNTIETLILDGTYICAESISELISRNKTIKFLSLIGNGLEDECLKSIQENKTLEILHLSRNKISNKGFEYIAQNKSLKSLVLSEGISDIGINYLKTHATLEAIYMPNFIEINKEIILLGEETQENNI